MTFEEIVDQAIAMVRRRGRVTYRMLQRHFGLDTETLEDLGDELLAARDRSDAGRAEEWAIRGEAVPKPAVAIFQEQGFMLFEFSSANRRHTLHFDQQFRLGETGDDD